MVHTDEDENSRGGGTEDTLYETDDDPNVLGANRNDDGQWLNAYNTKPDNRWNRENGFAFVVPQLSSILPSSRFLVGRGVLFCDLPLPPTHHLVDGTHFFRDSNVLLVFQ